MAPARTIQARVSPDLWSWLERYRKNLDFSRSAVIVDALELLRLDEQTRPRQRDCWALLHHMRADLWRAEAELPTPVRERLDRLVSSLDVEREDLGAGVVRGSSSRRELIAALVYDAPASKHALEAKVKRYRRACGGEDGRQPSTGA
jgi:hypothetical protein